MATYVNDLRLTELATGEGSGTWGTTTNTNLELIGEALGYATQQAFGSDADTTTTVADGVSDPARAMYYKVTSAVSLTATRTLTIAPNTLSRVMFIENATTGSQSIAISQGSGANVTIAAGRTAVVYLDGAGSGAAVVDALALVDPGVTDTLAEVLVAGNTSGGTNIELTTTDKVQFRDTAIYINSSADGQLDIVADTEVQIAATTIDVNGTLAFDSLKGTGATTVTNILDEDNMGSDSATALATQQSIKAYVDSQVGSFDTLAEVLAQGNTTGGTDIAVSTGDDITFADSSKAIFGAGSDLEIYHTATGNHSIIEEVGGGNLVVRTNGPHIEFDKGSSEYMARMLVDGAVELYYDSALKLATTATGIDVTGTVTADGLTVDGTPVRFVSTSPMLYFMESGATDSNHRLRQNFGNFVIQKLSDDEGTATDRLLIDGGTGDISFYEDTGTTAKFFWDASAESLGIGGSTSYFPNTKLTVGNTSNSQDGVNIITSTTGTGWVLFGDGSSTAAYRGILGYQHSSDAMYFSTAATERMRIDSNGLVQIGTTSNTGGARVDVVSNATSAYTARSASSGASTTVKAVRSVDSGAANFANAQYDALSHAWVLSNTTQAMTLDASANLDVVGRVKTQSDLNVYGGNSGSAANRVALCMEGAGASRILVNGSGVGTNGSFKVDLTDSTGTVGHTLTYDASGNLLVGTTSATVSADAGFRVLLNRPTTTQVDSTSGTTVYEAYSTGAGAFRFYVDMAGTVHATSTSITAISDESLKENIRDLDKGLDTIKALKPRRFDWKNGDGNDIMGFVAQEVKDVLPELVHDYKLNETETKLGLKMGDMIPSLVKAIQEQQATIEALTARIAALES